MLKTIFDAYLDSQFLCTYRINWWYPLNQRNRSTPRRLHSMTDHVVIYIIKGQ